MAPFSMRCESCGEYIYKGKKFNARKETVEGEQYLSIKIFRFYIRCPRCSAEITFKTDPKNTDYVAEHGASRNFEPWRGDDKEGPELEDEEEDVDDPMKSLENRTLDSKREMEIMDALDEIRLRNARSQRVNVEDVLDRFSEKDRDAIQERLKAELEEDERQATSAFQSADGERVRKLAEDEEPDAITLVNKFTDAKPVSAFKMPAPAVKRKNPSNDLGISVKRKKDEGPKKDNNALSMLASYADSDGSDSE